jgi:hypothetical protein
MNARRPSATCMDDAEARRKAMEAVIADDDEASA